MRRLRLKWVLVGFATIGAVLASGCNCSKKKQAAEVSEQAPAELLIQMAIRSPEQTVDNILAIVKEFVPLPLNRDNVGEMLLRQVRLPKALLSAVDQKRTAWFLIFDKEKLKDSDPSLLALPIRSADAFKKAMTSEMEQKETSDGLIRYIPKGSSPFLAPLLATVDGNYALMPSSAAVFKLAAPYLKKVVLKQQPAHEIEIQAIRQATKEENKHQLDRILTAVRERVAHNNDHELAKPLTDIFSDWLTLAWSAKTLSFAADLNDKTLTLLSRAESADGTPLADYLKSAKTGAPLGHAWLPADNFAVFSQQQGLFRGKAPGSLAEIFARAVLKQLVATKDASLDSAVSTLVKALGDSSIFTLGPSSTKDGIAALAIYKLNNASAARRSLETLATAILNASKASDADNKVVEISQLATENGTGKIYRVTAPQTLYGSEFLTYGVQLFGQAPEFGWMFCKDLLISGFGKSAAETIKQTCDASLADKAPWPTLDSAPACKPALKAANDASGMACFSLFDAIRALSQADPKAAAIATALAGKEAKDAPFFVWGPNPERTAFEAHLRLPFTHISQLTGLQQALMSGGRGLSGGGGLPGGGTMPQLAK